MNFEPQDDFLDYLKEALDLGMPAPAAAPEPIEPAFDYARDTIDYTDYPRMRELIMRKARESVQKKFPLSNERYTLALENVQYGNKQSYSLREQKQAVLNGTSLGVKMTGSWVMTDNETGKTISRTGRKTLMNVPWMTNRGTFIRNGTETTMAKQFRLVPAVYTRRTDDGRLESQFNVRSRTGPQFRLFMEPKTSVFYMRYGGRKIPLLPILKAMGHDSEDLKARWGEDIYAKNKAHENSPHAISFIRSFQDVEEEQEKTAAIQTTNVAQYNESARRNLLEKFNKMELDGIATESTLGKPYENVSTDAMADATSKILSLSRGEVQSDDRDSLEYQRVHDISDFLAEKITHDQGGLMRTLMWKFTNKNGDLGAMPPGVFDKHVNYVFNSSGLGQNLEAINPFDALDQGQRISRLGEGGIASVDQVPKEARNVQPSYANFIDPVRAPECVDDQTLMMTRGGWVPAPDINEDHEIACMINGELQYHTPVAVTHERYSGPMYTGKSLFLDYCVTPNHRMWVRPEDKGLKYRFEFPDKVSSRKRNFKTGGHRPYTPEEPVESFTLPEVEACGINRQVPGNPPIGASLKVHDSIVMEDWASFMGWFLSEGSTHYREDKSRYVVDISQSKEVNPEEYAEIEELLDRLPFSWHGHDMGFRLANKQLTAYLKVFGKCSDKYIPDYMFKASSQARRNLLHTLMQGDARKDRNGVRKAYCTVSKQLAEDVHMLMFSLGIPSRITFEKDDRSQSNFGGCWIVTAHYHTERQLTYKSIRHPEGQYSVVDYDGAVHCATVPGGLIYIKRGRGVGFWCGNSLKIGVDMKFARNVRKGEDGLLYTQFTNARTGEKDWVDSRTASRSILAFPESLQQEGNFVMAMTKARGMFYVPRDEVDYVIPSGDDLFSIGANTVPLKSGVKGMRLLMGSKFVNQALPLVSREAPFVQTTDEDGIESTEKRVGVHLGAVRADKDGVVTAVRKDRIDVQYADGSKGSHDLYEDFPFNRKTGIRNMPAVKAGQPFKKGDLLASSNYTDDKGVAALGRNMRVAYMNYDGKVFEDAIVISAKAAKTLTSEHMYHDALDIDDETKVGKNAFRNLYPGKYNKDQLSKLDDRGLVKPGTILQYGDPLFVAYKENEPSPGSMGRRRRKDISVTWKHHYPGVVTDSAEGKNGFRTYVRANAPMRIGDKLSNRFGGKGVISDIIPDEHMPRDAKGRPYEVLLSPLGVISRTNSAQMVEAALGKIAEKTGESYVLPGFSDDDMVDFALNELRKHNLKDRDDVYDPRTKKNIAGIFAGNSYFYKLQHTSEAKGKSRSISSYTQDEQPAKGGKTGAKHIGDMEIQAILAHGAGHVLKDLKIIKGQKNDDFWRQLKLGETPTMPGTPLVYEKFKALIRAAGVELREGKSSDDIFAMTNAKAKAMTGDREIKNARTYGSHTNKPLEGGLFDPEATGSLNKGDRWSYIKLPEPMPNPVMIEPMRSILGLKQKEFIELVSGDKEVNGARGPAALTELLKRIDLPTDKARAIDDIKNGSKAKRDSAVKRLNYLDALEKQKVQLSDFMMDRVPVLPPRFRRITKTSGMTMVADPNYMYKTLLESIEDFNDSDGLSDNIRNEARGQVFENYKALVGLTDPKQEKLVQKKVGGILQQVFGKGSPKAGFVQRRVIGTNIDVSGLGVITPNPSLKLNEVGMPEDQAWDLYEPFIIRYLVQHGTPATVAAKSVANHAKNAYAALKEVIKERPVLINRAPTLHKYNIMAFNPVLTKGSTLQVPPAIVKPFAADFDGDTMAYSVPVSAEAVREARDLMMPEKNLLSARNDKPNFAPSNEYLQGLYFATKAPKNEPAVTFNSLADAKKAYRKGEIAIDTPIKIRG